MAGLGWAWRGMAGRGFLSTNGKGSKIFLMAVFGMPG